MSKPIKVSLTRLCEYLAERGPSSAGEVGAHLWPERTRTRGGVASQGGGDYPAQMLLGRAKKAGLVRHAYGEGSSLWEVTPAGRKRAAS